MKHSRIIEIPDEALNEKLIPANDNYQLTSQNMETYEAGSVLAHRDYARPRKRNKIGLIVVCVIALAMFILKFSGAY
jgi:hypothetical protein